MIIEGNKYIYFQLDKDTSKTQSWYVINKSSELIIADICWYGAWRQYTFNPRPNTTYNDGCLEVIIQFITRLNTEKRFV